MAAMLNIMFLDFTSPFPFISSVVSLIFLALILVSPMMIIYKLCRNKGKLEDDDFKSKWGFMYYELKTGKAAEFLFFAFFFIRRLGMVLVILLLKDYT